MIYIKEYTITIAYRRWGSEPASFGDLRSNPGPLTAPSIPARSMLYSIYTLSGPQITPKATGPIQGTISQDITVLWLTLQCVDPRVNSEIISISLLASYYCYCYFNISMVTKISHSSIMPNLLLVRNTILGRRQFRVWGSSYDCGSRIFFPVLPSSFLFSSVSFAFPPAAFLSNLQQSPILIHYSVDAT
jgi:hypothetical protein